MLYPTLELPFPSHLGCVQLWSSRRPDTFWTHWCTFRHPPGHEAGWQRPPGSGAGLVPSLSSSIRLDQVWKKSSLLHDLKAQLKIKTRKKTVQSTEAKSHLKVSTRLGFNCTKVPGVWEGAAIRAEPARHNKCRGGAARLGLPPQSPNSYKKDSKKSEVGSSILR